MSFSKKTWKNRVTQFPNNRKLIHADETEEIVQVERAEGDVTEEGDVFSAGNMNDLETRIDTALTAVQAELDLLPDIFYEEITTRDGNGTVFGVNANSLSNGYFSVAKIGKQVTVTVSGKSSKTSTDWLLSTKDGYKPSSTRQTEFEYFLGTTKKRGYIDTTGLVYFEGLNNSDIISAHFSYNIG